MTSNLPERTKVFISYRRKNKDSLKRLRTHLAPFEEELDIWDATKINPGAEWQKEIKKAIESARVAVLLVSADFLASDFITKDELPPLLTAAEEGGATILSVILSPCAFKKSKLAPFQAVNDPAKPLSGLTYHEQEKIWAQAAKTIRDAMIPNAPVGTSFDEPTTPLSGDDNTGPDSKEPSGSTASVPIGPDVQAPINDKQVTLLTGDDKAERDSKGSSDNTVSVPIDLDVQPHTSDGHGTTTGEESLPQSHTPPPPVIVLPPGLNKQPLSDPPVGRSVGPVGPVGQHPFIQLGKVATLVIFILLLITIPPIACSVYRTYQSGVDATATATRVHQNAIDATATATAKADAALGCSLETTYHRINGSSNKITLEHQWKNNECLGISDGTVALDRNRNPDDLNYKLQAAKQLIANNVTDAESFWQKANNQNTSDAEPLIYEENQKVLESHHPYITIVVCTSLSGGDQSGFFGQDNLQGAYVAQKEHNDDVQSHTSNGLELFLLLANAGKDAAYAKNVSQQLVQLAKTDPTIVGVAGWPLSEEATNALNILTNAKIPMVSNAAADSISSSYFFRAAVPASRQAYVAAQYALQTLHVKTAAVFVDHNNQYSQSLANSFMNDFNAAGKTIVAQEHYTVGDTKSLPQLLTDALSHKPDLIYFAGYSGDVKAILSGLGDSSSQPFVLGGNALYVVGAYDKVQQGLRHLRFTAAAYPDEKAQLPSPQQAFFTHYSNDFDPQGQHAGTYGYSRTDSGVMLSYDSMSLLLKAISKIKKTPFTGVDLQQALVGIKGNKAFQGVSGQIEFGSDGNSIDKAIAIVCVAPGNYFKLDAVDGPLSVGKPPQTQLPTTSVC